jgi:hypothetical protein
MSTHQTTAPANARTVQLPAARTVVLAVYAACVILPNVIFVGDIVLTDKDPYRSEGPVESMLSIGVVSSVALILGVGLALLLARSPERARVGAVVLAALSVLTIVLFWSGAPGLFGGCAAWLAGLTRGGRPLSGAARVAGIVGAFVAALNILLSVGGIALSMII